MRVRSLAAITRLLRANKVCNIPQTSSFSRPTSCSRIRARAFSSKVSHTEKYTTAFAIFETLWEAGITKCFVNLGSDHPSIMEAIVTGQRTRPTTWPQIITCPSEITAISMADGYARVTGRPQAVVVHVDVGTQALGQGLHNASIGRAPVFILAGMCPFTEAGELPGSRTEYMHWLQEAPDQKTIVRQYCRYTSELRTGLNVKQSIARALQFASSAPKGPVYLAVPREVLAEEIEPYSLQFDQHVPVGPSALPLEAVADISDALVRAKRPLVITGYSGRDTRCPDLLVSLANLIPGLRVHDTGGSDMCFPFTHPASQGFRLSFDECTRDADMILLLDCDVPWIPSRNPPPRDARIYHVDIDPLNQQIPVSFFPAHGRWKADCYTALRQLTQNIQNSPNLLRQLSSHEHQSRGKALSDTHQQRLNSIAALPKLEPEQPLNAYNIGSICRTNLPEDTTFVIEAVTAAQILSDQLQPSRPGSWINCGGTGIGWSNGAALGVKMALDDDDGKKPSFVCQIVGDGSFMCAAPSSALWVAHRYKIPILTIVLNNGGWKAPRNSTELVYPDGLNKTATDQELGISFKPSPNYAALATAASGSEKRAGVQAKTVAEFKVALTEALSSIRDGRQGLLIEALLD